MTYKIQVKKLLRDLHSLCEEIEKPPSALRDISHLKNKIGLKVFRREIGFRHFFSQLIFKHVDFYSTKKKKKTHLLGVLFALNDVGDS